jgi:GntR family transcriptional regulator/MocR family aminotransferase
MSEPTPLPISLNRRLSEPAYRQIYERIRAAILSGSILPGTRLPSWNGLALQLGVARGTVKAAYDWLAGEGYVETQGAAGTIVRSDLKALSTRQVASRSRLRGKAGKARTSATTAKSRLNSLQPEYRGDLPFQMGTPALDAFPRKLWTRIVSQCARQVTPADMTYDNPMGYRPLREAVASYLIVARGIVCTADQIIITSGYSGALQLICHALLESGDRVWVEDPIYFRALGLLQLAGARIVPVPVDREGLRVDVGVAQAPDAKLAVVTPSHQSPLGMPLSLSRRLELLDWAVRNRRWIVEDDYYGEFNLTTRPAPALCSLDEGGRVLYAGTFSKTLLPSLRVGYLVIPPAALDQFQRVAFSLLPSPPTLTQQTVAQFMAHGHFGRHMQRMRRLYAERRQSLVKALHAEFGDTLRIDSEDTGLHLVAYLPARSDDVALASRAFAAGLAPVPLSTSTIRTRRDPALLLSFANISTRHATREARRLWRVTTQS